MIEPPFSLRAGPSIVKPPNLTPAIRSLIAVIQADGEWVELTWDHGNHGPNGRTPTARGLAARGCEVACRSTFGAWRTWARWPHGPVVAP